MEIMRVKDHGVYHAMSEHQKACYRLGLPQRYMSHKVYDQTFEDYAYDGDIPRQMPAKHQKKWALETKKHLGRNNNINGIVGLYSSPTDEAAFRCGGSIFEGAMRGGLTCQCVSASKINESFGKIPVADFYLIHGITDMPNVPMWSVRNFLRERDGSFRFLVMTASKRNGPWTIIHEIMRMDVDVLLCLKDTGYKASGTVGI